jgi:glutathione S-transferase
MKLYDWRPAPNPRRVRMFLAEKAIEVPIEEVGGGGMALKQEYVARFDPYATVPRLELDDGTSISEAMAICRYFEELHPEPPLMGRDAREKAIVEMWERRAYEGGMFGLSETLRNKHPGFRDRALPGMTDPTPQLLDLVERGKGRLARFYATFDAELAKSRFVAGPAFSVADITAFCVVDFMKRTDFALPPERRHMQRWYAEIGERPSAKA